MISMVHRPFIATILQVGVEIRAYTGTQESPVEAIAPYAHPCTKKL